MGASQSTETANDKDVEERKYYVFNYDASTKLPAHVDLRQSTCFPYLPPENQGYEGSCVSFALKSGIECAQRRSRIALDESVDTDAKEHFDTAFSMAGSSFWRDPSQGITFSEALRVKQFPGLEYYWVVPDTVNLKQCLFSGYPVVFGFAVTKRMYQWQNSDDQQSTGYIAPAYDPDNDEIDGFHSALIVGYHDRVGPGCFLVRNSWGENWGDAGHFWIPYATLTNPDITRDALVVDFRGSQ